MGYFAFKGKHSSNAQTFPLLFNSRSENRSLPAASRTHKGWIVGRMEIKGKSAGKKQQSNEV